MWVVRDGCGLVAGAHSSQSRACFTVAHEGIAGACEEGLHDAEELLDVNCMQGQE